MKCLRRLRRRSCVSVGLRAAVGAVFVVGLAPQLHAQMLVDAASVPAAALPDAPSSVLLAMADDEQRMQTPVVLPPPCPPSVSHARPEASGTIISVPSSGAAGQANTPAPCIVEHPLRIVVDNNVRQPLSVGQKGHLAVHDVIDPFNLLVIGAEAGIGVGANSHSPYGPGMKGFGKLLGYQLVQDAQGEFFGTFLIPSLAHEDPRYRRMEHASVKRRIFHALGRTVIAEHDDGRTMPNYATLLTYPISAELSNLYVPGVQGNAPDTAKRIAIGFATDPVSNIIAEFLPDFARRIHVRSVFIQQIVNNMALNQSIGSGP